MKGAVFVVLALLVVAVSAQCSGETANAVCTQDRIYNGCFCFWEWNDANRVGNWTTWDAWLQLTEPAVVGFVSVAGDNTITVDEERTINELYVGPNRWDTTRIVVAEDLTITYDDVPAISAVNARRLVTGETRLVIQGKGFGFESDSITVTATEVWDTDGEINIDDVVPITYDCEQVKLGYRDAKIECNIAPIHLMPSTLMVSVFANGQSTDFVLISDYIQ
mmetsp:Transcript_9959/g.11304  ORF Transcript_9959/g.11304 Transcript_9959/m.11304 type:complete len:221 (-) Transcript_9959:43-705(-)|eukprot:CAMPEP_0205821992 /NCGR_PEP_ID=MMETSP0206-20130828/10694_1 /ASSEMBLY_ACC=CAM_ASM_000279 /TAXON_ID=36767 /ORGANISM="Euplotes focardii, Strain TN1" /LENGTH=220 /DNA_ID=CAMNT_0053117913 /DNA_START=75 /DNA_END=737 /DNA_ORIENTATION=+